ncbi:response regulator transcription factor [Acidiferrimicrobium sp. IK]|uniref:response regulator transcription factor n=1 Tax=Acidiferrimicrobium sp. IK TaxID=2871700 RepID=UPI0021CB67AA|nr:response regulator transcription factor [Acidiferrimicrobium sp. IK]MCU4185232.1 response regulator transcription factor [Acidiferrimicrobium sp. IK]
MNEQLVMIVDDEASIRDIVRRYLEADGYKVVEAADGQEALQRFGARAADVVILDVMMPDMDGVEVLRRIRAISDVYVIMLTAKAEELDRLVGLAVGADDYITKPFSPRELVARVKAVLRRPRSPATASSAGTLRVAGLEVDRDRHEVRVDGEPVELTALEFNLVSVLAGSPGVVFTRRQLLERIWGYDFFGDERVVDVHVRNLRRKLADDVARPRFITTVRRVGYKMGGGR